MTSSDPQTSSTAADASPGIGQSASLETHSHSTLQASNDRPNKVLTDNAVPSEHTSSGTNTTSANSDAPLPQQGPETVVALQPGQQVQQLQVVSSQKPDATDSAVVIQAESVSSAAGGGTLPNPPAPIAAADPEKHSVEHATKSQSFGAIILAWLWELVACLFAVLMVVVEVVLLAHYSKAPTWVWLPSWKINSVFAFLTAILEAAVAFAIGACLGQLRWLWYHRGAAELRWLDRLTNARSAPGAMGFIMTSGAWKHWAGVGAFLVVALLGVGVFTQNVITQRPGNYVYPLDTWNGSVPISNTFYNSWQYGDKDGDQQPLVPMIAAINSGFVYPSSSNNVDTVVNLVSCPLGNCTFAEYSSLAVCSQCADISHEVVIPCNQTNCPGNQSRVFLPDDSLSLDSVLGYVNMTSDTKYPNNTALNNVGPLIAHFKGIGSVDFPQTPPYATECAIYWCVQTWNGTVTNFNFNESIVSAPWTNTNPSARTSYGDGKNITLQPPACYLNGNSSTPGSQSCTYAVDALTHRALQNYLVGDSNNTGFLTGAVVTPPGLNNLTTSDWFISTFAANAVISPCTTENNCSADFYSMFNYAITNMTLYMTNNLRKTIDTGPGYSYGSMMESQAYFHVRWGWLAYPICIVVISLIFLVVTMWKSRYTQPWKSSVVALILHGLNDADRGGYQQLDDPKAMKEVTETWTVALDKVNGTYAFRRESVVPRPRMGSARDELGHGAGHLAQAVGEAYNNS